MATHKAQKNTKLRSDIAAYLEKIVINVGVGRASQQQNFEEKGLVQIVKDISSLAGQKPQVRKATKSIAGFKVREGQIVGVRATLRGSKMVDFFERLTTIVLPRVRDFSGIKFSAIDQGGALNLGFKEQYVFPEISPEDSTWGFSLQVTAVAKKIKTGAMEKYKELGIPMQK